MFSQDLTVTIDEKKMEREREKVQRSSGKGRSATKDDQREKRESMGLFAGDFRPPL